MKSYSKAILALLIVMLALWGLTNSLAALSSASNYGVVAGTLGAFSSIVLPIWLLAKLYHRKAKNAQSDVAGNTGPNRDS